jgi:hypothetical protein
MGFVIFGVRILAKSAGAGGVCGLTAINFGYVWLYASRNIRANIARKAQQAHNPIAVNVKYCLLQFTAHKL